MLLHVEYWLAELRTLLYDSGLGDLDVNKLTGTCLLASSAMEPVSTEAEELLLLYGLGDLLTKLRPFSPFGCVIVWTSFRGFVTKSFLPFRIEDDGFGGTFSSKSIGSVLDFFTGRMGLLGGALGGFLGVVSSMGGDRGPLKFGGRDPFPLTGGEHTPLPFVTFWL